LRADAHRENPHAIPATALDPSVRTLEATANARIGAYIGVPIVLSDGSVFGSLGCLSHEARVLGDRDVRFMELLANLAAPELERNRERDQARARISTLIDTQALEIALQPIFDVHEGACLGVEALARFPDAYGGTEAVFQSAYSVGLGSTLERLALGRAVALLPELSPGQFLAVNLTPNVAYELAWIGDHYPDVLSHLVLENHRAHGGRRIRSLARRLAPDPGSGSAAGHR